MPFVLNYDEYIHLDAEELAAGGIGRAYESLLPTLHSLISLPAEVSEYVDPDAPSYGVECQGQDYLVFAPELDDHRWVRAAYILFQIVNQQLAATDVRFYAIDAGNDLGGMFLSQYEYEVACRSIPDQSDWPYLPTLLPPKFGMH